jgi:hypothetical protein
LVIQAPRKSKTHVSIGQALTMAALAAAFAAVVTALMLNIYSYQPVAVRGVISQAPYPTSPSTSWKVGMSELDQDQAETEVATGRVELERQDASAEEDTLVISEGTIEDDPHIKAQSLEMENITATDATTDMTTHPLARQNQTTITTIVTTTDMTTHPLARQNQTTSLPTSVPTNLPTQAPTNPPTNAPSDPLTNQPTFLPTNTPTNALKNPPTMSPRIQPTHAPTLPPTNPPTINTSNVTATDTTTHPLARQNDSANSIRSYVPASTPVPASP